MAEEQESYIDYASEERFETSEDVTSKLLKPEVPDYLKGRNAILSKDLPLANLGYEDYHYLLKLNDVITLIDLYDTEVATWEMVKQKVEMDALVLILMSRAKEGTQLKLLKTQIAINKSEAEDLIDLPAEVKPKKRRFLFF